MKKILLSIILLALISCSSPEIKIYSLYVPTVEQNFSSKKQGGILYLSVKAQRHLQQSYIIFKDSPFELNISSYAKWYASPEDIIKQNIVEMLSSNKIYKQVRTTRPQLNEKIDIMIVNLKDFSRYDEGQSSYAMLQFNVVLRDKDNVEIYTKDFKIKERLDDKTYLSLAKGMSNALLNSLNTMAKDISRL